MGEVRDAGDGCELAPWGMNETRDLMRGRRTLASNTVLNAANTLRVDFRCSCHTRKNVNYVRK